MCAGKSDILWCRGNLHVVSLLKQMTCHELRDIVSNEWNK
jgi:hypothetical protein